MKFFLKINVKDFPVTPENLGKLINLIGNNTISGKIAKDVFPEMLQTGKDPETIVKEKNLVQITDTSELDGIVIDILNQNESQVQEYISGKDKVFGFFVGQAMRATKGKANPQIINEILRAKLEERKNG